MFSSTSSTHEKIWLDKSVYDLAEKKYYEKLARPKGNLSSTSKERKTETVTQESPKKCFVGLEKDVTGTYKAPEKVWVDKPVYDLAEKEYYEKLEKSRLVSNDKDVKQEQIVDEVDTKVIKTEAVVESIFAENDDKLVNISDPPIDESTPTIDISINDTKVKYEKTANELLREFIASDVPSSPIKPVKLTINEDKSSQVLLSELTDEKVKTESSPVQIAVRQAIHLQTTDELVEKQVISPDKNIKISDDKNSQTERTDDSKESLLLQDSHESSKQQKVKINEQQFVNDIVGIKRKASDEKKVQDSTVKGVTQNANTWNSLAGEVAKARQHIKNSLQCIDDIASITSNNVIVEVNNRINTLETENTEMKRRVKELTDLLTKFEERLVNIEKNSRPTETVTSRSVASGSSVILPKQPDEDEDDGVDLFASDSEEENAEATKIKEQRLAEYAAKKSKKPAIIAKSSIVLDVKPWDDTTDMKLMEEEVRKIKTDGLLWGASKLVPLAYGIHKLQISCVVEDEKVSVDWLQETIETTIEDYVQSVDIAAFNKI